MISIVIQARLNSSRLPAKVLLKLPTGRSVLEEVIHQCQKSCMADKVVVVTCDEIIANIAVGLGAGALIGSEEDVWSRYVIAAQKYGIDTIVRITADCPLITPDIIDMCIMSFINSGVDYLYNHHDSDGDKGDGFDVEVFKREALLKAKPHKEHVTWWLRNGDFKTLVLTAPDNKGCSLDTLEDFKKIYEVLA